MLPDDVAQTLRDWLKSEGLEVRERQDDRTTGHLLVRYPSTKHGHVFNLACPTGRDLVVIGSLTQVDVGQQEQMSTLAKEDPVAWNEWLHETRLQLTRAEVDWVLHVCHSNEGNGPLQAFHISEPTWRDGLSKHRLMSSLRRLWLAKLAIIHEIKFAYVQFFERVHYVHKCKAKARSKEFVPRRRRIRCTGRASKRAADLFIVL